MKVILNVEGYDKVCGDWDYPVLPRIGERIEPNLIEKFTSMYAMNDIVFDERYKVGSIDYDYLEDEDNQEDGEIISIINSRLSL